MPLCIPRETTKQYQHRRQFWKDQRALTEQEDDQLQFLANRNMPLHFLKVERGLLRLHIESQELKNRRNEEPSKESMFANFEDDNHERGTS
jgi:hypothetical protein